MMELLELADKWAPLAAIALDGLLLFGVFYLKKTFVPREEFERDRSRLEEESRRMETRLTETEVRLDAMPGPAAVQELLVGQARMEGKIMAVDERITGLHTNVHLLLRVHTEGKG
jgi:hypothetical protein